jgi:hypothetical protein
LESAPNGAPGDDMTARGGEVKVDEFSTNIFIHNVAEISFFVQ